MKLALAAVALALGACSQADIASHNLSRDAEEFRILRQITFYDAIQGVNVLSITGFCSVETEPIGITVTCRTEDGKYLKHFLGHADNMTFFAEQLREADVSTSRYKVIVRPSALIPDIEVK